MATPSIICRGKNLHLAVMKQFLNAIPKCAMPKLEFFSYAESRMCGFTQTHSQIARQMGLYYCDVNGICHPRFTSQLSLEKTLEYARYWAERYFVPNPYTPSFPEDCTPKNIYAFILSNIASCGGDIEATFKAIFNCELNETDKAKAFLFQFTDILDLEGGKVSCPTAEGLVIDINIDRYDELAYFHYYDNWEGCTTRAKINGDSDSFQRITYGAPGTGKSFSTNAETKGKITFRTTFHPDSDYSTFVGAYKPTMIGGEIGYSFVAQAFVNAYVAAWTRMKDIGAGSAVGGALKEPTGVDLVMVNAAKKIIEERGLGCEATREEIVAKAEALDTYKKTSLLPSDYCYNRVNAGMSLLKPTLFEYLGNAKYKCLGLGAAYDGPIYRRASGADEDIKVGVCEHGVRKLDGDHERPERVYLVIEEINRGNCAQIFGDLFQLLDRNDAGFSDYPIEADADLAAYIHNELKDSGLGPEYDEIVGIDDGKGKIKLKLCLPPNLYIRATMNTSDQSLFPIDSAFKRRWDWEYAPIKDERKGWYVTVGTDRYDWWSFLEKINKIVDDMAQSADKQMGYFFVKLPEEQKEIDLKKFVNKVAFYLWNDVFKDCEISDNALKLRDASGKPGEPIKFTNFFKANSNEVDEAVVKNLFEGLGVKTVTIESGKTLGEGASDGN